MVLSETVVTRAGAVEEILAAYDTVTRHWARDFKRTQAPIGLTATQFAILGLVVAHPQLNTCRIAAELDLAPPTVVRAIDALARKGLIERRRSESDARQVVLQVSAAGREAWRELDGMRRCRLGRLLARLSDDEIEDLLRGYAALARATEADIACPE